MSFFKSTGRRPGIETLEAKQLLAGDVLVGVVGGNLIITGDEMDNNISVESGAVPGQYLIHGRQDTKVTMSKDCPSDSEHVQEDAGSENVDAENVVVVNGVKRGARIRMADGDDTVVIKNARFSGNVSINMGEGHDSVNVGNQLVFGPPRFPPGYGTNPVQSISTINATSESSSFVGRIMQVENDGEVRVKNGIGEWETFTYDANTEVVDAAGNEVPLDELEGAKVRVTYHTEGIRQVADKIQVSRFQIDSGTPHSRPADEGLAERPGEHQGPGRPDRPGGSDRPESESVEEPSVVIKGGLRIVTGGGEDRGISVDDDIYVVDVNIGRGLQIHTGDGVDDVFLKNINVGSKMAAKTGNSPNHRTSGRVHVGLGDGTNRLVMSDIHAGRIVARGGEGNDEITVGGTESRLLAIHGGRGEGSDRVKVSGAKAQIASVRTAAGDDRVILTDSALKVFNVQLGEGADSLGMGGVSARLATLSGGPGDDDLFEQLGENLIAHERVRGFELPPVEDGAPETDTGIA